MLCSKYSNTLDPPWFCGRIGSDEIGLVRCMFLFFFWILLQGCGQQSDRSGNGSAAATDGEVKRAVTKKFTDKEIYPRFLLSYLNQNKAVSCEEICKWNFKVDGGVSEIRKCDLTLNEGAIDRVRTAPSNEVLGKISCTARISYSSGGWKRR